MDEKFARLQRTLDLLQSQIDDIVTSLPERFDVDDDDELIEWIDSVVDQLRYSSDSLDGTLAEHREILRKAYRKVEFSRGLKI